MAHDHSLINMNIHFMEQGEKLLQDITDDQYRFTGSTYFNSSAGKHMRHVLDHYLSLLEGEDTTIDYDARTRDERVEKDRAYAIKQFRACINRLKAITAGTDNYNKAIRVRSNESGGGGDDSWSFSSINRELQFLIGHTVHHYALVAFILRVQDFSPPEDFGIAPSTLKYEQQTAQKS